MFVGSSLVSLVFCLCCLTSFGNDPNLTCLFFYSVLSMDACFSLWFLSLSCKKNVRLINVIVFFFECLVPIEDVAGNQAQRKPVIQILCRHDGEAEE